MSNIKRVLLTTMMGAVSVLALDTAVGMSSSGAVASLFVKPAFAETHSGGGQGQGGQGQGGQGQGGSGTGGHDDGGHSDGGSTDAAAGGNSGQGGTGNIGGPSSESDGQGPRAGQTGTSGGKPVWASEGIPEVELGRLSVARSPDSVLNRALNEAVSSFTPEMADFYNLPLNEAIDQLATNFDNLSFIDSPLQNLALLKDALDGTSILSTVGVSTPSTALLSVFLGTASDKTVAITPDTAFAVVKILTGVELTEAQATALAIDAEAVRVAILTGHG